MNLEEIKDKVLKIQEYSHDDEYAHSMEDSLYYEFIQYVASLEDNPIAELAAAVLKAGDIEFSRWCA